MIEYGEGIVEIPLASVAVISVFITSRRSKMEELGTTEVPVRLPSESTGGVVSAAADSGADAAGPPASKIFIFDLSYIA